MDTQVVRLPFLRLRRIAALAVLGTALVFASGPHGGANAQNKAKFVAGQILVASEKMTDPRFTKTVVFVIRHDQRGAFGLIVNRPLGDAPIDAILKAYAARPTGTDIQVQGYNGGPVEPQQVNVLHTPDYRGTGTQRIGVDAALTDPKVALPAIAIGKGPRLAIVTFGYTGWGGGQLEAEITDGAWQVIPPDTKLLFEVPNEAKWETAYSRRGVDL